MAAPAPDTPRSIRVLAVDDEESIRQFEERVLRDAGYQVVLAADGLEALNAAEEQGPFDLFVLDVSMPHMLGDELGRRLRQRDPDVKILYLTAHTDRLFAGRPVLWEQESFVEKPVSVKGLLEAVSLALFGDTRGLPR